MLDNCPVCKTVLNGKQRTNNAAFSNYAYDCPRCGKFVFKFRERDLECTLNRSQDNDKRFILSHNIRKRQKDDSEVVLDGNLIEKIFKGALPTPAEQKDIFIRWVGDNTKAGGDFVRVDAFSIIAIIGARTEKEFYFIFEHLKTKGIVKNKTVVGGGDSALMDVTLSFDGWEYYEKLKRGETENRKSSMEIESVSKKQTDEIHESSNVGKTSMEWDVFICHASEDKVDFVEPLANALKEAGIKVWYDRFELKLGDSLRGKIDEGLANSRYGVVVLSKSFFNKEWPQKELDGLAALEVNGRKVILPVWHGIGVEEVRKFSPILASRLAAQSSDSLESIVVQIKNVLNENSTPKKPAKDKRDLAGTERGGFVPRKIELMEQIAKKLRNWVDQNKTLIRNFSASLTGPLPPMEYERVVAYLRINNADMAGLVQEHYEELISCAKKIDILTADSSCSAMETADSLVGKLRFLANRLAQTLEVTAQNLIVEQPVETETGTGVSEQEKKKTHYIKATKAEGQFAQQIKGPNKRGDQHLSRGPAIKAAWIVGICTVVAACITGIFMLLSSSKVEIPQKQTNPKQSSKIVEEEKVENLPRLVDAKQGEDVDNTLPESSKLESSDFELKMHVSAHGAILGNYTPPEAVSIYLSIGKIHIKSDVRLNPELTKESSGGRNPLKEWRYAAPKIYVSGLQYITYLDDLIGEKISTQLPVNAFKFKNNNLTVFQLYFYVKGREILLDGDKSGNIEYTIKEEDLKIKAGQ